MIGEDVVSHRLFICVDLRSSADEFLNHPEYRDFLGGARVPLG